MNFDDLAMQRLAIAERDTRKPFLSAAPYVAELPRAPALPHARMQRDGTRGEISCKEK